jgi:hypothetical protein
MFDTLGLLSMICALAVATSIAFASHDSRRLVPIRARRKF